MKTLKLLIVDDDIIDRAYYQRLLNQFLEMNHKIFEAENSKDALRIMQSQEIDCVLLDYQLPDGNGIDLLIKLKESDSRYIPIIMLTGSGDEDIAVKSIKAGAADYIRKSKIDPTQLVTLIKNLIRNFYLTQIINQQKQQIQTFSFYDFLTGLIAFPTFYQILKYSIADAIRFHHSLAVIYIDIDNFVMINDSFGHLAGDEILVEMSKRLKNLLPSETICRSGEDEFFILLSADDIQSYAGQLAQKIQKELKKPYILVGDKIKLTVSQGIAYFDLKNTPDELLKKAEEAIFLAKKKGGNQIKVL